MTWLAQISDLHIQVPGARIGGRVDTTAYLERCIERPPAFALHARTASGLVSHHLYVDRFDGPYPF
jgi:hypothetical protein